MPDCLHAVRRSVALAGLTLMLGATVLLAAARPAAAADEVVTIAAGATAGPVFAEIGEVITIVGANHSFTDLAVPGHGVLPDVVVTTIASPASVSYTSSGAFTEPISFSYGSVVFPTDVPEQAILDVVASVPLPDARLEVQVADPPPLPSPATSPPLPAPPPVVTQPAPDQPPADRGSDRQSNQRADQPPLLPAELGADAAAPILVGVRPESDQQQTSGAQTSTPQVRHGIEVAASVVDTSGAGEVDDLPMALGLPSLLAVLSICVLGAGLGRLKLGARRHWR